MKLIKTAPMLPVAGRDWNNFFDRLFTSPLFPERAPIGTSLRTWEPALDLSETEKEFVARLEVPGFHKENLDVHYDGEMLVLSGHRTLQKDQEGEDFLWHEREEGQFMRSIRLPKPVDEKKVKAEYQEGVLTVSLPKVAPTPKAKIAIT